MNTTICINCRASLRRTLRTAQKQARGKSHYSAVPSTLTRASRTPPTPVLPTADLASLLSRPTWSVRSLLPQSSSTPPSSSSSSSITPKTLHHLLRLSALPLPRTPDEEAQMLSTLSSQLHFVRAIQDIDTRGVTPLRAIRDETAAGLREQTIGLAELREALEAEDIVGHARRPRRRLARGHMKEGGGGEELYGNVGPRNEKQSMLNEEENWDVLGGASETAVGRYFVVRSGGTGSQPDETAG
ncbi:hypothetical protein F5B22DRAFT_76976 [Xylaria bambusicola]|uniref:uncharacterized protein n=1 Tax=Xylaria bambusicola TaxID=326684 RepID=UPI0020075DF0|nr:uncharacterized protein F5B22DRAFT_76976 [Xylaria bambusicola]KAI0518216.1 hypothetical protein F5B22DRAFT_76976 [Xylaria bambusicola]